MQQGQLLHMGNVEDHIQIIEPRSDDPGILAGNTFGVTSGILAKGILINQKGQKEMGMIAKNHEPNLLAVQAVDDK